jgi:maltoporin
MLSGRYWGWWYELEESRRNSGGRVVPRDHIFNVRLRNVSINNGDAVMCRDYYPEYEEDYRYAEEHHQNLWYEDDRYHDIMVKIDNAKFLLKGLTDLPIPVSVEEIREIIELLEEAENV